MLQSRHHPLKLQQPVQCPFQLWQLYLSLLHWYYICVQNLLQGDLWLTFLSHQTAIFLTPVQVPLKSPTCSKPLSTKRRKLARPKENSGIHVYYACDMFVEIGGDKSSGRCPCINSACMLLFFCRNRFLWLNYSGSLPGRENAVTSL